MWTAGAIEFRSAPLPAPTPSPAPAPTPSPTPVPTPIPVPSPSPNTVTVGIPAGRTVRIIRNRKDTSVVEIHVNKSDDVKVIKS